jgi:hypothetical protein
MCCGLSTMRRRRNFSSRPNWSRDGPQTSDLGLRTSDFGRQTVTADSPGEGLRSEVRGSQSAVHGEILLGCVVRAL